MPILLVLFIVLPLVDLLLLLNIGFAIGLFETVLLVVVTGMVGYHLAKQQGLATLNKIQESLARGAAPTTELLDGLFILIGGVLLVTPGVLTDLLGLAFIIPPTRAGFRALLARRFEQLIASGNVRMMNMGSGFPQDPFGQAPFGQDPFGQQPPHHRPSVETPDDVLDVEHRDL